MYGKVVLIPYSCITASSTKMLSLGLVGVGRLWAYTVLSCLGVNLLSNSVFIPIASTDVEQKLSDT